MLPALEVMSQRMLVISHDDGYYHVVERIMKLNRE
jgi:ABC-type siderophore export system fused ATPase/permease subunit